MNALPVLCIMLAVADAPSPQPVAVPFELLKTKHMAVLVKVNGKGPYRVIFDTGAPVTLLSNKVARESGLFGKKNRGGGIGLFGSMGQFTIQELEVGGLKAEKVSTVVMDHPLVGAMAKVLGPIEGIVGFPFFARYAMTIDYQAKEMTFVPNGFQPADYLQKAMSLMFLPGPQKPRVLAPAGQWGLRVDKAAKDEEAGVTVTEVLPGSAAALAGLKVGDRLLTLDGRWTDTVADCFHAAVYVKPGTAAKVVVRRDGKEVELTVTPRSGL